MRAAHAEFPVDATMSQGASRREPLEVRLLAVAGDIRRAYNAHLDELGVNITESGLLQFLAVEGPLSQSGLAQRLHIGRMSAGTVAQGLVQRGLVTRHRNPDDRRAWLINLTPAGVEMAQACAEVDREVVQGLRRQLTRDDQATLHSLLDTLGSNARELMERVGDDGA